MSDSFLSRRHLLRHGAHLGLASLTGLAAPAVWAQRPVRIGLTKIVSHAALDADEQGFLAAMASAGYREGVNLQIDRGNAQGDPAQAAAIAQRFVRDKVDLIYAIATPTAQAAIKATRSLPVVFSSVTDPVKAGIVPSNSRPNQKTGTNVTGVSDQWPVQLQMETYAAIVPQARAWGTIYNPAEVNSVAHIDLMRRAARQLGLVLTEAHVNHRDEVPVAARSLVGKVQAIAITSDNTTVSNLEALVQVCQAHRMALFAGDIDSVQRGAIAAFGMDYFLVGYAAGRKAALVLKGVKPGDVPWGPVEKFSLVINQAAARSMGVAVPADVLARADKVLP